MFSAKRFQELGVNATKAAVAHAQHMVARAGGATNRVDQRLDAFMHLGLLAHTQQISWAGPLACDDFGRTEDEGGVGALDVELDVQIRFSSFSMHRLPYMMAFSSSDRATIVIAR